MTQLLLQNLAPYSIEISDHLVGAFMEHLHSETRDDVHSAFCMHEASNTSGRAPTPGQVVAALAQVKVERKKMHKQLSEQQRLAKRDELNRSTQHITSAEQVENIQAQWGLVPAWRINSDGTPGWNWGGVENCMKLGATLINGVRVPLYVRKSHLDAFNAYHEEHRKLVEQDDWVRASEKPELENYKEGDRHYIRANRAARAEIEKHYQKLSIRKQESFNGSYDVKNEPISQEWLDRYKQSDHYKNCMEKISKARGPIANDVRAAVQQQQQRKKEKTS